MVFGRSNEVDSEGNVIQSYVCSNSDGVQCGVAGAEGVQGRAPRMSGRE